MVSIFKTDVKPHSDGYTCDRFKFRKEIRKKLFPDRLVDEWNKLSSYVVEVNTIESFFNIF